MYIVKNNDVSCLCNKYTLLMCDEMCVRVKEIYLM